MSNYRRSFTPGACFFFTVVTHKRINYFSNKSNINLLRKAFHYVKNKHPFAIEAIVVLPDHLHTLWQLPENDSNYSLRWRLIKHYVSSHIKTSSNHRREKQVWQRRFWEHEIRNEIDWRNHMDYIHYNPVKHGYVTLAQEWEYSSICKAMEKGWYDKSWGCTSPSNIDGMELE